MMVIKKIRDVHIAKVEHVLLMKKKTFAAMMMQQKFKGFLKKRGGVKNCLKEYVRKTVIIMAPIKREE